MKKIPVIILSGFLGSGKTTLLIRLLVEAKRRNLQASFLMNEIGKSDVDGHILQELMPELSMEKLLDGCICCSIKSEVTNCLQQLIGQKPDLIFIELTGIANPEEVADSLTEPELIDQVSLKQIITILDAENTLDYNSIFATDRELVYTLRRQIEVADVLIVNKIDLIDIKTTNKIEKVIRKQNPQSKLIFTTQSEIDMDLVFNNSRLHQSQPNKKHSHQHSHDHEDHHHHHGRVQTHTISINKNVQIKKSRIEKLLKKWNSDLLRVKGYMTVDSSNQMYLLQFSGKRTIWEKSNYSSQPYFVIIGIELNIKQFDQDWKDIVVV